MAEKEMTVSLVLFLHRGMWEVETIDHIILV